MFNFDFNNFASNWWENDIKPELKWLGCVIPLILAWAFVSLILIVLLMIFW
jgi:hypothetical protein